MSATTDAGAAERTIRSAGPGAGPGDRYRELLAGLLHRAGRADGLWIVVTSALRGEGVTTVALGLSWAMAESHPTLLLELNCRHPSPVLGACGDGVYLDDVLLAPPDRRAAMLPPAKPGLYVIRARETTAPYDRVTLARAVAAFRGARPFGVIDAPAVLSHPDSLALGGSVDGSLLVVQSGRTPWQAAARARDLLRAVGLQPLGIALNKRRHPIPARIYGALR